MDADRENQDEFSRIIRKLVRTYMTKLSAKCKMCRRAGEKLFLKGDRCNTPKCGVVRKPSPPGMHGAPKRQRAQSEYGQQLAMKQRVKRIYVVLERQLNKYFHEVKNQSGVVGDLLMQKLEILSNY